MKKSRIYYLFTTIVIALFVSCSDGDNIWENAARLDFVQKFDIENASNTDTVVVDFSNEEVLNFKGEWNIETAWEIIIEGNESKQTDTIRGYSKSLEGISWNGNVLSGEHYFPYEIMNKTFNVDLFGSAETQSSFKQGETCTITLCFSDYYGVDTCKSIFKIAKTNTESFSKSDYCVFGDWETTNTLPLYQDATITTETSDLTAPEGSKYCLMQGTETGGKWYIAGGGFSYAQTSGWSEPNGYYPITLADTATTYLNFFMYGFPEYCERTSVYVALMNGDEIEAGFGDRFSVTEGWHGISIPVSKFVSDANNLDYNKVNKIIFSIFSNGEVGDVKCAVDCFVITKKYPLFPIYNSEQ